MPPKSLNDFTVIIISKERIISACTIFSTCVQIEVLCSCPQYEYTKLELLLLLQG